MQYKFQGGVTRFLLEVGQQKVDVNLISQKKMEIAATNWIKLNQKLQQQVAHTFMDWTTRSPCCVPNKDKLVLGCLSTLFCLS